MCVISILEMRKLRFKGVTSLAQGHTQLSSRVGMGVQVSLTLNISFFLGWPGGPIDWSIIQYTKRLQV